MGLPIYKKVVLIVIDGLGVATWGRGNAVANANPGTLNFLVANYPSCSLQASGPLVGLPWGEMGNSEVGHLNIGAGRIVGQDLPRINATIQNRNFFANPILLDICAKVKAANRAMHIIGLLSPGGVHSSDEHAYALLELAREQGIEQIYLHMFTDGRDTGERIAPETLAKLEDRATQIGAGVVATVTGRFFAMDRGEHWEQTIATANAIMFGIGEQTLKPEACITSNYAKGIYDEMIPPTVVVKANGQGQMEPVARIQDGDGVIFFNFRSDRMVQLLNAFRQTQPELTLAGAVPQVHIVSMTKYSNDKTVSVAFPPLRLYNTLPAVVSKAGMLQFHIAESEKYAHVTSFFNGGELAPLPGEERVIVKSPDNAHNYVDHPQMSAGELTDILVEKVIRSDTSFFIANFANPDMVGHTGSIEAATQAVASVDQALEKIYKAAITVGAAIIITADHGNVEQMINTRTGEIDKDHTTNPVPCLFIIPEFKFSTPHEKSFISLAGRPPDGVISDVAPTVLELLGLPKPADMDAVSLIRLLNFDLTETTT
jgi:2,3-bisphosphoglycerate-independent phosphoglycerate mutase